MAVEIRIRELPDDLKPYDDPEDFEEQYDERQLLGDVLAEEPNPLEYESRCVMVFGIPMVGSDRLPKLKNVLGKLFGVTSPTYTDHYPTDEEGKTKGFCFIEYPSKEIADTMVQLLDGHVLDKNHTFGAYNMVELRNIHEPDPKWEPPTPKPYTDVGDLWWWLQNPRSEDQFAVLEENTRTNEKHLSVLWNARGKEPYEVDTMKDGKKEKANRPNWTEFPIFKWSPEGSFLVTLHRQGAVLWAGPNFARFQRFEHSGANYIDFSPKETYIVTYAYDDYYRGNAPVDSTLKIFDTFTGELKKTFSRHGRVHSWPYFKWSADEKYFAFSRHGQIHVYETEHFELLDKKSIELDGLITFEWNPSKNLIAYYCEERVHVIRKVELEGNIVDQVEFNMPAHKFRKGVPRFEHKYPKHYFLDERSGQMKRLPILTTHDYNKKGEFEAHEHIFYYINASAPAEIGIMEIPSKQSLRAARIYSVSTANLFWQKAGNYLAAHTERYGSRKIKDGEVKLGGIVSHLEIFDCSGKDAKNVSVQTLKLPESFISFGWDPKSEKFCVLVGTVNKVTPLVYKIVPDLPEPSLISTIEPGLQLNTVSFAPQGGWLVVYGSGSNAGHVFFIDTNGSAATRTRIVEHASVNYGAWDPTGRYFVTCAVGHHRLENGYRIHTFQGRELSRKVLDGLSRFRWRPRPPSKLDEKQMREIRKNLKTTSLKFAEEDRKEMAKASEELIEKRRKIMEAFDIIRNANIKFFKEEQELRLELRNDIQAKEADYVEETVTIPLTTKVEPLMNQEVEE